MDIVSNGWEGNLAGAYGAYAIEFDPGYTTVISSTETLSRMTLLYHECGVEVNHLLTPIDNNDDLAGFLVMALSIKESLSSLAIEHDQMKHLKGYPVYFWTGVIDATEDGWDLVPPELDFTSFPLLAIRFDPAETGKVFGASGDLIELADSYKAQGGIFTKEMWNAEKTKPSAVELAAGEFLPFVDFLFASGKEAFVRDWISYSRA